MTYVNWSAGEPNNGGRSNVTEECVVNISFSGKWNDFPCDTKFNFICKMKAGQLRKNGWPCVLLSSVTIAILRLKNHGPECCIEAYIAKIVTY